MVLADAGRLPKRYSAHLRHGVCRRMSGKGAFLMPLGGGFARLMITHYRPVRQPRRDARAKPQPLFVAGRRHPVAILCGDVLSKKIRSEHLLRNPVAIAFDRGVLGEAERLGARFVRVEQDDSGTVYTCSLADFRRFGVAIDRGFGAQLALPLARWSIDGAMPTAEARAVTPVEQRSLFDATGDE